MNVMMSIVKLYSIYPETVINGMYSIIILYHHTIIIDIFITTSPPLPAPTRKC
jgi:hypothetical protein